ncbi:MAG: hypothetical protein R3E39_24990 [Anaerolineae bacterium]
MIALFRRNRLTGFVLLSVALSLFIIGTFVLVLPYVLADVGTFSPVNIYTYETIVDMTGGYEGVLPNNISGTIVGMTVFRQEPNTAWYPVVFNSVYDDDNIAEAYAFEDDGRHFGGYFRHNEDNWKAIDEHIGKRIRVVLFLR